jgi:CDP-glycerol glycerophosphotransferase (TagB/SpsB family)
MLELAKNNQDIQIVLRPHPFLWSTLTDRKVLSEAELRNLRESWDALPNTYVDEDGSYAELFLATDALMTDGISFLGEYPLVTGKPAIFFENAGHWEFTETGSLAAESSIRVMSFTEFEQVLSLAKSNNLPSRQAEIAKLVETSSPHPGESAKRIIEIVYQDFVTGPSPLQLTSGAPVLTESQACSACPLRMWT